MKNYRITLLVKTKYDLARRDEQGLRKLILIQSLLKKKRKT